MARDFQMFATNQAAKAPGKLALKFDAISKFTSVHTDSVSYSVNPVRRYSTCCLKPSREHRP